MINGIKPIVSKPKLEPKQTSSLGTMVNNGLEFDVAIDRLLDKIQEDYTGWGGNTRDRKLDLKLNKGRKFIKVIEGNRVWGFVAKIDGIHKGLPMAKGDIMKAAGWNGVAKHSRGSIFDSEMHKSFSWTGPNYL